jgi:hypothetical protein
MLHGFETIVKKLMNVAGGAHARGRGPARP